MASGAILETQLFGNSDSEEEEEAQHAPEEQAEWAEPVEEEEAQEPEVQAEAQDEPGGQAAEQTQEADPQHELEDDVQLETRDPQNGADNLFGSDDDDADEQATRHQDRQGSDEPEDDHRQRREHTLGPAIEVEAPLLPAPAPGSTYLLRTTNIVSVQPKPFEAATFELEEDAVATQDEFGRARVQLAQGAVVRWRWAQGPDGQQVAQSNARFVRWEDGTTQLLLGDEVLDVANQDTSANNTYLFCLRGLVQGQGHLAKRLALRPASLESGLHKRLREAVDKRHTKVSKVNRTGGLINPELAKAKKEAAVDERIKSREALLKKQDKVMARAYGGGRAARPARLSERYLEDEQDWEANEEEDISYDLDDGLTAQQRARLSLARQAQDDDVEAEGGRRLQAAKRGAAVPAKRAQRGQAIVEDELGELGEGEEEEDFVSSGEDEGGKAKGKAKTAKAAKAAPVAGARSRRGVVLSSDEDE